MPYGGDSVRSLLGKKFIAAKPGRLADAVDFFVLLCSFLLTTASLVLVALIFYTQAKGIWYPVPISTLSILQRAISALSATITSAVIIVAGKRYVLSKLARGGIRSRKVAVYTSPSIGNIACYLARNGIELPLFVLTAVWALGLATGLTFNDAWAMVPGVRSLDVTVPVGPFDTQVASGSLLQASGQLNYIMQSACSGFAGSVGFIEIISNLQLTSGGPMGPILYPPPPDYVPDSVFSLSTLLNGFNVSMELLSSIPYTAQNLTCVDSTGEGFGTGRLWYGGANNQTLSIVSALPFSQSFYRFNASAIILGGTLQSTSNTTTFAPNGTTWPNVMSDNVWAQDIVSLVCNATFPLATLANTCTFEGSSLFNLPMWLKLFDAINTNVSMAADMYWSTALDMAMGAYSSAALPQIAVTTSVSAALNDDLVCTSRYGVYVLIVNIAVSLAMLVTVVRLRMASRLGADFLNATRLLLDPLKNPELFNAPLDATVDALANPYMVVKGDNEFLLEEQACVEEDSEPTDNNEDSLEPAA